MWAYSYIKYDKENFLFVNKPISIAQLIELVKEHLNDKNVWIISSNKYTFTKGEGREGISYLDFSNLTFPSSPLHWNQLVSSSIELEISLKCRVWYNYNIGCDIKEYNKGNSLQQIEQT